jgi:hypothetical protein
MPITTVLFLTATATSLLAGTSHSPPSEPGHEGTPQAARQDLHNPPLPRWGTEGFGPPFRRLVSAIEAEAAALPDHPWAGSYRRDSFGLGDWMDLAPESGFIRVSMACSRAGYAVHGYVSESAEGQLILRPVGEEMRERPEAFWPVSWGRRRYLVPEDGVVSFANDVNSGELAMNIAWQLVDGPYHRQDGHEAPVKGLPDAPPAISRLLLAEPLEGQLSWVADEAESRPDERTAIYQVRVDKGERDGVFVGMELYVRADLRRTHAVVEVVEAGADWATGRLRISGALEPRAGMAFTSRSMSAIEFENRTMRLAASGARAASVR